MRCARASWLVVGLCLPCCSAIESVTVLATPPEGVDLLGALLLSESNEVVSSTGLVGASSLPLDLAAPNDTLERRLLLVGYARGDLGDGIPSDDVLSAAPLVAANDDQRILPAPRWSVSGMVSASSDLPALAPAASGISLSSDWVPGCDGMDELELVQQTCVSAYCEPAVGVLGCRRLVDGDACDRPNIGWRESLVGDGVGFADEGTRCEVIEPPYWASTALECVSGSEPACRIYISERRAAPLDFVVATVPNLPTETLTSGDDSYYRGVAVLEDRLVLATDESGVVDVSCDASSSPGLFEFLDRDSLESIGTATSPPCVGEIVQSGDGFIAVYGPPPSMVGRFDADGRLLFERQLPQPDPLSPRVAHNVVDDPEVGLLILLRITPEDHPSPSDRLIRVNRETFEVEASVEIETQISRVAVTPTAIAALDDAADHLHVLDRGTLQIKSGFPLLDELAMRFHRGLIYSPPTNRLATAIRTARAPGILLADLKGVVGRAVNFESVEPRPSEIVLWPSDDRLLLVAMDGGGADAALVLFDMEHESFLPGRLSVGHPRRLTIMRTAPGRTDVWMVQASTNRVLRVFPASE